jgi:hypothetical protein
VLMVIRGEKSALRRDLTGSGRWLRKRVLGSSSSSTIYPRLEAQFGGGDGWSLQCHSHQSLVHVGVNAELYK